MAFVVDAQKVGVDTAHVTHSTATRGVDLATSKMCSTGTQRPACLQCACVCVCCFKSQYATIPLRFHLLPSIESIQLVDQVKSLGVILHEELSSFYCHDCLLSAIRPSCLDWLIMRPLIITETFRAVLLIRLNKI